MNISRLAIEQDVDLVLVADRGQLDDPEVTAVELGAWLAASWQVTLRLAGPAA